MKAVIGVPAGAGWDTLGAVESMSLETTVLAELPDLPRWVEARGLLLAGRGQVIEDAGGARLIYSGADRLLVPLTVDMPAGIAALAAAHPGTTVLLQDVMLPSARWRLPDWTASRATLYSLPPEQPRTWRPPAWPTALVTREEIETAGHLPGPLRDELLDGAGRSPVWAAFDAGRPVSFAYAARTTESWFDVSVDTLEASRNRGFGRAAAIALITDLLLKGLNAVWGAVDGNLPSERLAARLGFVPVDELWVMTPPA